MTAKTWRAEYYPISAAHCKKSDAVEHSLRKWLGALPSNLKRHSLMDPPIEFDSNTCSLCKRYMDQRCMNLSANERCEACPLYKALGKRCYGGDDMTKPYNAWFDNRDPNPMIRALRKTLKEQHKLMRKTT